MNGVRSRRRTGFIWATLSGSPWATIDKWTDDSGHKRQIGGQEIAHRLLKPLFYARDLGETTLWQSRLRGLSAIMYPDAGVSIYDGEGRSLISDILHEASVGIAAEQMDLHAQARLFRVTLRRRGQS